MKRILTGLLTLLYGCTAMAQTGLTISELLFQPYPGEAEYVELYNNSDWRVDLSDYHIVRWVSGSFGSHYALPSHIVESHDYVVLTTDAASVAANYDVKYPGKVVECSLPQYPNAGGRVVLATAFGAVVDTFDYSPSMHSRLLRNKAGVALERRSFAKPTDEPLNWYSASSVCGYGTPGYENSQSRETLAEERWFAFSSTIVSPDGDGYQDWLEVVYDIEDGELMGRVELFDARGVMVRRLVNNLLLGTHGTIVWDCRDENDRTVARGHYIVLITLYGTEGTQQVIRRAVAVM